MVTKRQIKKNVKTRKRKPKKDFFSAFKRNKDGSLRTGKGGRPVFKKGRKAQHKKDFKDVFG